VNNELEFVEKSIHHSLSGEGAHVEAEHVFEGTDWQVAGVRPDGVTHSLFQLLNHLIFWQDWVVNWLDGNNPHIPETAADSWPGSEGPANEEVWREAIAQFTSGVEALNRRSKQGDLFSKVVVSKGIEKSRIEMFHTIASHNSFHLGQVVFLRRMLGAWPPPSGGLTW
jgi:hypothetical protein